MSTSLVLRRLPILVIAATLVACGAEPRSQQPQSDNSIVDAPIVADVPIGPGWDVAENAPILADVPVGAGWDAS
jgi:hypothetical protein